MASQIETADEARTFILNAIEFAGREEVMDAIVQWNNTVENAIDDKGDVWVSNPQRGHWLNEERLIELARFLA